MEVARHDSLADQLLELHALEEARIAAEEEARVQAALEAQRRQEAEAGRRRQEEEEARRQAEEQALAEARAQQEAEDRRALQVLEAGLRTKLERQAQAHVAELEQQLERRTEAAVKSAVDKTKVRSRWLMAGVIAVVLAAVGAYGFVIKPVMESQELEIARMRQEMKVLHQEKARLQQEVEELQSNLERMQLEQREMKQLPPAQKRSRQRTAANREPERPRLEKPRCNENDPLCGI